MAMQRKEMACGVALTVFGLTIERQKSLNFRILILIFLYFYFLFKTYFIYYNSST